MNMNQSWFNKHGFKLLFILPALLIYSIFLLIPIVDSMGMSMYTGEGLIPDEFVGLDNYIKIFTEEAFYTRVSHAFVNNILFFLMVTLIQNVLGFFIAFAVTRKIRGIKFLRKVSFLPTTLSVLVVGFLFKQMLNPVWGLFGKFPWLGEWTALPMLAIAVSWQFIGESVLFYTAGIDGIPAEIMEAADIDGASALQKIRHIILPSIMPIIGMVTLLIFIGDFTQFDIVYSMATTNGNPAYATDLFGSLFYRTTFSPANRGGWGTGMGAAVSTIMVFVVSVGVGFWLYFFRFRNRKEA